MRLLFLISAVILTSCSPGQDLVTNPPTSISITTQTNDFPNLKLAYVQKMAELKIPALEIAFIDNIANLGTAETLNKQLAVLSDLDQKLTSLTTDNLTTCDRIDLEKMRNIARDNIDRAQLGLNYLAQPRPAEMPDSLAGLPLGKEWYGHFLNRWNTAPIDIDQMYRFGETQLAKSVADYDRLVMEMGFDGDPDGLAQHLAKTMQLAGGESTEKLFRQKQSIVRKNLSHLFVEDYGVEPAAIKQAPANATTPVPGYYRADEKSFYYNVMGERYPARQADWLFLHEATPGHHFQLTIQAQANRCDSPLPDVFFPAYVEGWAAYVETLGPELGLYQTPEAHLAAIEWDMVRSARVAIDVGLNAYGWSDAQALTYWHENVRGQRDIATLEITRMKRWPAQVTTYKYGADVFLRLSENYVADGSTDLRQFHHSALIYGAMPLATFETLLPELLQE